MVGKKVEFRINNSGWETLTGIIMDKFQGYKWIDSSFPSTGRVSICVNLDYYLIDVGNSLMSVACGDIKKIL